MKKITFFIQIVTLSIVLIAFQGCREESLEIAELDRSYFDVTSYDKLFETFWDTLNNDYNFFNEQETNWDDIYREYSPKFKALTTFGRLDVNNTLIKKEAAIAFKYFADIITQNIIDEHFALWVNIPFPTSGGSDNFSGHRIREVFFKGMKYRYSEEEGFKRISSGQNNPTISVYNGITSQKLIPSTIIDIKIADKIDPNKKLPVLFSGSLKDDPNTMYIRLADFAISETGIERQFPELTSIENLSSVMDEYFINNFKKFDNALGELFEKAIEKNIKDFKSLIKKTLLSDEYKAYKEGLEEFKNKELVDKLQSSLTPLISFIQSNKVDFTTLNKKIEDFLEQLSKDPLKTEDEMIAILELKSKFRSKINEYKQISGFTTLRTNHVKKTIIKEDLDTGLTYLKDFYHFDAFKKLFNPITNGTVKKIILDLRGNGGGYVNDARIFTDRFLTKQAVWGYQRTKEGNGRFNYSPWFPIETKPHKFGLKQDIPIAVLIDKGSMSMSEVSTMMIKSQGNHVTILGDNSRGGSAGLGGGDDYNGGNTLNNGYLDFYMPLMAFKNNQGKVIEGIGVTPDIKVIPTKQDAYLYRFTGIDPVFNKALEVLK